MKVFWLCLLIPAYFNVNIVAAQSKKSSRSGFRDSILHRFVYRFVDTQPEPDGGAEKLFSKLLKK
jgi:hypothetical protein